VAALRTGEANKALREMQRELRETNAVLRGQAMTALLNNRRLRLQMKKLLLKKR